MSMFIIHTPQREFFVKTRNMRMNDKNMWTIAVAIILATMLLCNRKVRLMLILMITKRTFFLYVEHKK